MNINWIKETNYHEEDTQKFKPVSLAVEVMMFHPVSKKRQIVVRYSDKYIVMIANGWVELG